MAGDKYVPYSEKKLALQEERLSIQLSLLPKFASGFFKELSRLENKAPSTLIAYANDLKIFFTWVQGYLHEYSEINLPELPIDVLKVLHVSDIKSFMLDYVPEYSSEVTVTDQNGNESVQEHIRKNTRTSSARKLATLKKFFHYFNNLSPDEEFYITNDPVSSVKQTKDIKKPIKYLDDEKTAVVFNAIETGEGLAGKSKKWNIQTKERDKAIIALFLGTGLRVSELVGINLQDINLDKNSITVFRKERRQDTVYMSSDVSNVLLSYLEVRISKFKPSKDEENALFLSLKHNRISVSAVERTVNKYTQIATGSRGYSCHKLRDTFGTRVYAETGGNAKKVQTAMNHKSASTSLDYYVAAMEGKEKEDTFKNTHIAGISL